MGEIWPGDKVYLPPVHGAAISAAESKSSSGGPFRCIANGTLEDALGT